MACIYILLNSKYCSEVFTSLHFASDVGQIFTFSKKKKERKEWKDLSTLHSVA